MNRKITAENLKNLNDGETIETPRVTFNELICRGYLSEYLGNDGLDNAWERMYNHRAKWLNWELGY
jgi:hypothetical protein